jgi:hypothetical protein
MAFSRYHSESRVFDGRGIAMLKRGIASVFIVAVSLAVALTARAQGVNAPAGVPAIAPGAGTYDELKKLLMGRYDQESVVVQMPGLYAGERERGEFGVGRGSTGVVWSHFAADMQVPNRVTGRSDILGKKTSDLNQLDDHTFGDLQKGLNVSRIEAGESLKVSKFYVYPEYIEFILETTGLGHLQDVDYNKASRQTTTTIRGNRINQSTAVAAQFGLAFRFYFKKGLIREDHDYAAIVSEINRYLLPQAEARELLETKQNIEIQPGMSEEQVVRLLGQPTQAVRFGDQRTLKYPGMTVILKEDRVIDLKVE